MIERMVSEAGSQARGEGGGTTCVLIVDNDQAHAETVAESLERVGYVCTVAASGAEGARRIKQESFDIVITDLKMSDVDGLEILGHAKELLRSLQRAFGL